MSCYVEDVIRIARAEVGYLEKASNRDLDCRTSNAGNKNFTKYARDLDNISGFYNGKKNGFAWCDVFVDWCFYKAYGVENAKRLLCQPSKSSGAGCLYSMRYYRDKGQFREYPVEGDQIFFYSSDGGVGHTGLVYKVDNTYVYTVEGNTSSVAGVVANGGSVREKKYRKTDKSIAGYGRPKYDVRSTVVAPNKIIKVGDIVDFKGTKQYSTATASRRVPCKPGAAKVTAIYLSGKHPYHLVRIDGSKSTVYGWVDSKDVGAIQPAVAASDNYQTIHTVVKGDSYWSLAVKYLGGGIRYKEIMQLNGKRDTVLNVGEKLKIPKK